MFSCAVVAGGVGVLVWTASVCVSRVQFVLFKLFLVHG